MTKYLVLKGMEGWGDRLECLLQAIGYCDKTKRTLVVDWRDPDWYHDRDNQFENYIHIRGIQTQTIDDFTEQYIKQEHLDVMPSSWSGDVLFDEHYNKFIYNKKFHIQPSNDTLFKITTGALDDYPEQVVVSPGVRNRSWQYKYSANLQFDQNIIQAVANVRPYVKNEYNVLHIRGGTKHWVGGHHPIDNLSNKLKDRFPNMISYIRYLQYGLSKVDPNNELPLIICSDNKQIVDEWLSIVKVGTPLESTHCDVISSGTHKIQKHQLKNTTKHVLNTEMLRDFIIMCDAKHVIHDDISTFSRMASKCNVVY